MTVYRRAKKGTGRWILCLAAAAAALLPAGCGRTRPDSPHVLVVVISGLRADHSSAYGYPRPTTPSLERLAGSGTLYVEAISPASWGPSAQASILTGLYPTEHAMAFGHPMLEPELETLPEKLKRIGYDTIMITTDSRLEEFSGFRQGFDSFRVIRPEETGAPDEGAAETEATLLEWLDERSATAGTRPFFGYVVLTNPHLPFNAPADYRDRFVESPVPLPKLEELSQLWVPFARQFTLGVAELSPEHLGAMVGLYDGEVAYADYRLGRIVEGLEQRGLLDDTLIVVTSDAGEDLGDHGLLADASSLFDSIIRVPLVMRLPGRISAGNRITSQVQTNDLVPAVLALVADGEPVAAGDPPMRPRPAAVSEARVDPGAMQYFRTIAPGEDLAFMDRNLLSVRTGEYKFILTSHDAVALFDLREDPGEKQSIAQDNVDLAAQLAQQLGVWKSALQPPPTPDGEPAGDAGP